MIRIGSLKISPLYDESLRAECLNRLSEERRAKACRIKTEKEKARSIGAGYLLESMLQEYFGLSKEDIKTLQYKTGEHGKPELKQYPGIHFNLSHSGDYVVCAISDSKIGIDVQRMDAYRENVAKRFYSREEQQKIAETESEADRKKLFYAIWTGKESYTKWLETGLTVDLSGFTIDTERNLVLFCETVKNKATEKILCNLKYVFVADDYCCCVSFLGQQEIIMKQYGYDVH